MRIERKPGTGTAVLLAAAILAFGGCAAGTHVVNVSPPGPQEALVQRLAGTVGIHYPESFSQPAVHKPQQRAFQLEVTHGKPASVLLERSLGALFEKVVPLTSWSPGNPLPAGIDLVIVPELEGFWVAYDVVSSLSIAYRLRFYAAEGVISESLRIDGLVNQKLRLAPLADFYEPLAQDALRRVFARLLIELPRHGYIAGRFKPSATDPSPAVEPAAAAQRGIVIIALEGRSPESEEAAQCLGRALAESYPAVPIVAESRFRDALFPWFEPGVAQHGAEAMKELLGRPLIRRRIAEVGAQYLVVSGSETRQEKHAGPFACGGGAGAVGCFGISAAERTTRLELRVWDLSTGELRAPYSSEQKGHSIIGGFLIPGWYTAGTERQACLDVARQMAPLLSDSGRGSKARDGKPD